MKLLLSCFLFTLTNPTNAFAPTALAKTRLSRQELSAWNWSFGRNKDKKSLIPDADDDEPKSEGGYTSTLLGDQADAETVEKEAKGLLSWFKKGRIPKEIVQQTAEQDELDWEVKDDGIFGFIPTKEMTGVEPEMTQLCATISTQLYNCKSFEEFKLSTKEIKTDLFLYDNHDDLDDATPPFCVATTGKTMILGWKGSNTLCDFLNDAAASPQSSFAWRKHRNTIKAQGAMTSIVHNDLVNHEKAIIRRAKELCITEIITTGQSLGGGCAQIGVLTLRAQIEDEASPWNALEGVNVRSVAFCGPMTTVLLDNATPATDKFIEGLVKNSCNIIYKNDPVPRGYGYLSFIEDFVDDASDDLVKAIPVPGIFKRIIDLQGKIEDLIDDTTENEKVLGLLGIFSQYRHLGNIVHYAEEDAKPTVLKDMGAFHKNTAGEKNLFRSVKYIPYKGKEDFFVEAKKWHMEPIRGPGLAYPKRDLRK